MLQLRRIRMSNNQQTNVLTPNQEAQFETIKSIFNAPLIRGVSKHRARELEDLHHVTDDEDVLRKSLRWALTQVSDRRSNAFEMKTERQCQGMDVFAVLNQALISSEANEENIEYTSAGDLKVWLEEAGTDHDYILAEIQKMEVWQATREAEEVRTGSESEIERE